MCFWWKTFQRELRAAARARFDLKDFQRERLVVVYGILEPEFGTQLDTQRAYYARVEQRALTIAYLANAKLPVDDGKPDAARVLQELLGEHDDTRTIERGLVQAGSLSQLDTDAVIWCVLKETGRDPRSIQTLINALAGSKASPAMRRELERRYLAPSASTATVESLAAQTRGDTRNETLRALAIALLNLGPNEEDAERFQRAVYALEDEMIVIAAS